MRGGDVLPHRGTVGWSTGGFGWQLIPPAAGFNRRRARGRAILASIPRRADPSRFDLIDDMLERDLDLEAGDQAEKAWD